MPKASAPVPAVPVGVATVKQQEFPVYLTGLGSVQAFNTVSLKTRIDGQITQVNFPEGQEVKQGELLNSDRPAALRGGAGDCYSQLAAR